MEDWFDDNLEQGWTQKVGEMKVLLSEGDSTLKMMQVTGEEGVSLEDFLQYQKALFLDMVYLQQDAFDKVDASVPIERQKQTFNRVYDLVKREYAFSSKEEISQYFLKMTGLFKNLNYAEFQSKEFEKLLSDINELDTQAN
jgi:V/A-type H+-transporting ATPase subunit A